jgi:hypothetical protein
MTSVDRTPIPSFARDANGRTKYTFVKAGTRKIDRGIAAVLAYEAAASIPKGRPRLIDLDAALAEAERARPVRDTGELRNVRAVPPYARASCWSDR